MINIRFKGRRDSSGVKLLLTERLRKNEIGLLLVSSITNMLGIQIPPKTNNMKIPTICYPECTEVKIYKLCEKTNFVFLFFLF